MEVRGSAAVEGHRVIAPRADPDRITDLLVALRSSGIRLAGLSVQKPTLDEVFLNLTGAPASAPIDEEVAV